MNYAENRIADEVQRAQDLFERDARRREDARQAREKAEANLKAQRWNQLQQLLRENLFYYDKAKAEFEGCKVALEKTQAEIQSMLNDGFIPPKAPAPAVNPNPSIIAKPTPKVEEAVSPVTYERREWQPCPVCSAKTPQGIAYHRTEEGLYCIVDARRAQASGLSEVVVQEALRHQAQAAHLGEPEPETVFEPEPAEKTKKSVKRGKQ